LGIKDDVPSDFLASGRLDSAIRRVGGDLIGARIGVYEITALLGVGGMGEVYRARDTNLGRDVAIKVLPPEFTADEDRLSRFRREARMVATLNHPHIGAIYGLEEAGDTPALVLELVEGETLETRIARGPLPTGEVLRIARQIAEAFDAAHERGIIHRDLKPANIKITPEGGVKVLDFGLARLNRPADAGQVEADVSAIGTREGMIVGTAPYMSPEQARGQAVDKRTDIWAFGCVVYEMLTGQRAFGGATISDTIAAVLEREPEWHLLPASTPPAVQHILRQCLHKDPKRRTRDIGDARNDLEREDLPERGSGGTAPAVARTARRHVIIASVAAAAIAGIVTALTLWALRPSSSKATASEVVRFEVALEHGHHFTNTGRQLVALSQDGKQIAYVANEQIYVHALVTGESKPLAGASGLSTSLICPVFSPDGRFLAFWTSSDQTLRKVAVSGGDAPMTLATVQRPFGMSWEGGSLFVGQGPDGILRVPEDGSAAETVIKVGPREFAHGPQLLPGGDSILFTLAVGDREDRWDSAEMVVEQLRSGERKTVIRGGADGRYLPSGHIVYARGGTLFGAAFDVAGVSVSGPTVPVVQGVRRALNLTGTAHFSVAHNGTLTYVPGSSTPPQRFLSLFDRLGVATRLKLPAGSYGTPRISPDGKHLAFQNDGTEGPDIWVYDLDETAAMRRLTFGGQSRYPLWSADGLRVTYQTVRDGAGGIFWQRADGTGSIERLTTAASGSSHAPDAWSPAGDVLLYSVFSGRQEAAVWSLWMLTAAHRKSAPVGNIIGSARLNASFSPDGRWFAYDVTDSPDARAIFVEPFPVTGRKFQVASGVFSSAPAWAPSGKELFFAAFQSLESVSVTTAPSLRFGSRALLPVRMVPDLSDSRSYDVSRDGKTLVGILDDETTASRPEQIHVVLNWFQELEQRVPITRGNRD